MFNNSGRHIGAKSMINPVVHSNTSFYFSDDIVNSLKKIEKSYTSNLANGTYLNIPSDYVEFSKLFAKIAKLQIGVLDSNISLLLNITKDGLRGAMNALGLNNDNLSLNIKNIVLQNQVNSFESKHNQLNIYSNTSGQYQITKTFTFIPLYSYYILLYGLPQRGIGFDPLRVNQLLNILVANNIDPYRE
jgi:hypothetical protein